MKNTTFNTKVLVIGIAKFKDSYITDVPNIKQNVKQMQNVLYNSDVLVSFNDKKDKLLRKMDMFYENTDKDDTVIIYYTGHGLVNPDDNEVYFTASDTSVANMENDGISAKLFYEYFAKVQAKRKVLIIDACHSGKILDYVDDNLKNSVILTSSSKFSPSYYSVDKPNTPTYFTGKLVELLQTSYIYDFVNLYSELHKFALSKKLPRPQVYYKRKFKLEKSYEIKPVDNWVFDLAISFLDFQIK